MADSASEQIDKLRTALATLEAQRATLGDAIEPAIILTRQQLEALEAQQRAAATPSSEERRLITILFTDMVGSTSLAEKLDPEDWRQTVARLHETVGNIISQHNGTVAQYLGDGLLAFFGAHASSEHDAENSIRAALEFQAAVGHFDDPQQIQLRVGIHTGLVVIGELGAEAHKEFTATGDAMNLAARLQSAAPPGGILISHETHRFVRGVFDVIPQSPLQVKGKTEPLQTYLVQRAKPRAFRTSSRGMSDIQTRTIGRARELEQLQHIYLDAIQNKRAAWVLLQGEPGLGKSRLVRELQDWVDVQSQRVRMLPGRAFANEQFQPFSLVRHLWFDRFEIADDLPIAQAEAKWVESFRELTGIAEQEPAHALGLLVGLPFRNSPYIGAMRDDPTQVKGRAFVVSRQILRAIREQMPLLVLLEDLHWADQASLEYLAEVMGDERPGTGQRESHGMFVLTTARNEWDSTFEKGAEFISMPLAPLSNEGARQLASELLSNVANVPAPAIDMIVERAEGVPYFVEEMVNYFLDRGIIDRSVTPWQFKSERLQETPLPATLQYLLRARLDALAHSQRHALQRGAVYGRNFWSGSIEAMGVATAAELLKPLLPRGLVEMQPESTFAEESEWSFHHALLRDVTYESVLKRERAALHKRAAEWLEQQAEGANRLEEFAGLLGEHLANAGELHAAAEWFVRAGERAWEQGAPRAARHFFDRALEHLPSVKRELRWRALLGRVNALRRLDEREAQQTDVEALLELAEALDDDARRAEALLQYLSYLNNNGLHLAELSTAQRALDAARRAGNLALEARALGCMIEMHTRLGQFQETQPLVEQALTSARAAGNDIALTETLGSIALHYGESGDMSRAAQLSREGAAVARRAGNHIDEGNALISLGYAYILLGMPELARAALEQSLRLAEFTGVRMLHAYVLQNLGLTYLHSGDGGTARQLEEEALREFSAIGHPFGRAASLLYLGHMDEREGDYTGAAQRFGESREEFSGIGVRGFAIDGIAGLARCRLKQGQMDAARQYAKQVWAHLSEYGTKGIELPTLCYLTCVEIFDVFGDSETSRAAVEAGYIELMARAEKISDAEWRKSFLENVPEHRAMVEMWMRVSKEKA